MRVLDLRDEGAQGFLDEKPPKKKSPTKPKAKRPERLNAGTTAEYTVNRFRQLQWGTPGAVSAAEFGRHFSRWHRDDGVSYREIVMAVELLCEEWPHLGLDVPVGRLFIKQRFDWITKAKEAIYHEDLPKKVAADREMWDAIYADLAVWKSDHPAATEAECRAAKAGLYQYYRYDPESKFAAVYA